VGFQKVFYLSSGENPKVGFLKNPYCRVYQKTLYKRFLIGFSKGFLSVLRREPLNGFSAKPLL